MLDSVIIMFFLGRIYNANLCRTDVIVETSVDIFCTKFIMQYETKINAILELGK